MICKNCGKKEATTHIKTNINGKIQELDLCSECALNLGYTTMGMGGLGFDSLLGSFFGESLGGQTVGGIEKRCPVCGVSFSDIARTGRVGCDKCYDVFFEQLLPSIQRMHGKTQHSGKLPSSAGSKAKAINKLDSLKRQLSDAIEKQEFEKAAGIRDEIKELEKEVGEND